MKSITLHKLPPSLSSALEKRAQKERRSLNQTAQSLLEEALGLKENLQERKEVFLDMFGTWDEQEKKEFHKRLKSLERVDEEDWNEE